MKAWPVLGILLMQTLLLLGQGWINYTWGIFWGNTGLFASPLLLLVPYLLTASFILAALLGFYFSNFAVRLLYWIAAVWLGLLNFLFVACCAAWGLDALLRLFGVAGRLPTYRHTLVGSLFAMAIVASLFALFNARWIRIRRLSVALPNLPTSWQGRSLLVASDLHLGNLHGAGFSRRIVRIAKQLQPDLMLIPGDLFDGSKADPARLIEAFRQLTPPFGIYFSSGNHDQFGEAVCDAATLARAGIQMLSNQRITVDGLQIVGVPYGRSTDPIRLRAFLESLRLNQGQASILLNHVPNRLQIAEEAGISLQLSGHTHGGQIFPFTWFTRRAFGHFTYGLHRFGALQVFTSSGAGSWGPPMRLGSQPELVLLQLQACPSHF